MLSNKVFILSLSLSALTTDSVVNDLALSRESLFKESRGPRGSVREMIER